MGVISRLRVRSPLGARLVFCFGGAWEGDGAWESMGEKARFVSASSFLVAAVT